MQKVLNKRSRTETYVFVKIEFNNLVPYVDLVGTAADAVHGLELFGHIESKYFESLSAECR